MRLRSMEQQTLGVYDMCFSCTIVTFVLAISLLNSINGPWSTFILCQKLSEVLMEKPIKLQYVLPVLPSLGQQLFFALKGNSLHRNWLY